MHLADPQIQGNHTSKRTSIYAEFEILPLATSIYMLKCLLYNSKKINHCSSRSNQHYKNATTKKNQNLQQNTKEKPPILYKRSISTNPNSNQATIQKENTIPFPVFKIFDFLIQPTKLHLNQN
uniref:Putative ovule protein n=1 Tax=Solanum chacoense TaxID=4108 RepID=A0A0V0HJ68_SOLCH